jgi:hypothetical protein
MNEAKAKTERLKKTAEDYIKQCDSIIADKDVGEAKLWGPKIVREFKGEISDIYIGLTYKGHGVEVTEFPNFLNDIALLRQKLIKYLANENK